jgi:hypothetical protein
MSFVRNLGLLLLLELAGCQSAPVGPTAAPPPLPPGQAHLLSTQAELAGRKLYVNKCARCHKFYDPARYQEAEWKLWMTKMTRKAKLNPGQTRLLAEYLEAYRPPAARTNGAPATN